MLASFVELYFTFDDFGRNDTVDVLQEEPNYQHSTVNISFSIGHFFDLRHGKVDCFLFLKTVFLVTERKLFHVDGFRFFYLVESWTFSLNFA